MIDWALVLPLAPLFALIAFVYGAVGLGGGSAYLAAMAVMEIPYVVLPQLSLSLNLAVAGGGFVQYGRAGFFQTRMFIPLVATSVPAAYLAARVQLGRETFQLLLGGLLALAGARMLLNRWLSRPLAQANSIGGPGGAMVLAALGLLLGAAAGLTGIGGGIYLSPLLVMLRLCDAKQAAALSSGFIVVNSIAGLAGRLSAGAVLPLDILLPLLLAVVVGGQLGARVGARRWRMETVQTVMGAILLFVSIRLLLSGHG